MAVAGADAGVRVRLLGELEVTAGDNPLPIGGVQRQALLALLAVRAPRGVSRAGMIDALWGEDPPATAVNAVQVHISALRRALGRDTIQTVGDGYRLSAAVDLDVVTFEKLRRRGVELLDGGEAAGASATLGEALALWRGPALAGLGTVPFVPAVASRLEEHRLSTLERRIEADLSVGHHQDVVGELEMLIEEHPLREELRGLLMRSLYRCGRQADALAVFEAGRRLLDDELGLEPSLALRDLQHRILQQSEPLPVAADARTPMVASPRRQRLPDLVDQTVGRERDIAALISMLKDEANRLVSILGPGGVGKTRVAIEVARALEDAFPDGTIFVPVAEAEKASDVAAAICQALELPAVDDAAVAAERALAARASLIVCDNFEHVVEAAVLLSELVAGASRCRFLVTSRQALEVRAERRYTLAPLAVSTVDEEPSLPIATAGGTPEQAASTADEGDASAAPAVELFLLRLRALDAGFVPSASDLRDIATICARCDGLPLALELAAARTRALSLSEVREHLSRPLDFLASPARDLPERQRTLRSSIGWSVSSLTTEQASFLSGLSVFRGGFTVAAAAAVVGCDDADALAHVETLLDHNLLQHQRGGPRRRFVVYETVREYAEEMLAPQDEADAHRRHAEHLRRLIDPPDFPAQRPQTADAWRVLVSERANLRHAVRWSLAGADGTLAGDLLVGVAGLWLGLGPYDEFQHWIEQLLERDDVPAGRRCDALLFLSALRDYRDQPYGPEGSQALELANSLEDTHRQGWALLQLAWEAARLGWVEEAERFNDQLRSVAELHPDAVDLQITALVADGHAAVARDELVEGCRSLEGAVRLAQAHRRDLRSLVLLNNLSEYRLLKGDYAGALVAAEEGVEAAGGFPDTDSYADLISQRGYARLLLGDGDRALPDLHDAVVRHLDQGAVQYALSDLLRLAAALTDRQPDAATVALGVYETAREFTEQPGSFQTRELLRDLPDQLGDLHPQLLREGEQLVEQLGAATAVRAVLERASRTCSPS